MDLTTKITPYVGILPLFLSALIASILLTPIVGRIAYKVNALDLPAKLRKKGEDKSTRINEKVTARLGGLSIVLAIGLVLFLSEQLGFSSLFAAPGFNSLGIWMGVVVLTVAGVWDDIRNLPAWGQFLAQIVAALFVVGAGVQLDSISIGDEFLQMFGNYEFQFILERAWQFPGDLIIVVWIVAIMNFVNWAGGIDALHGSLTSIILATLMLIAMQLGNPILAALIAVHLGAVLGVLPYNYYPSKIFYGFGESINGFLIAVFAISGDIKFAASLIILGLPLIDAVWVSINRMRRKSKETKNVLKWIGATMKGDRTHLHHRLLEIGYSWKTVMFIEAGIMLFFAVIAFLLTGFGVQNLTVQLALALIGIIIIFIVVNLLKNRRTQQLATQRLNHQREAKVEIKSGITERPKSDEEKFYY